MRILAKIVAWLPFPVLYFFSDVLALVASAFYRRKLVTANLTSCFPDRDISEIKAIRKEFYRNLSDVSLEVFKTLRMDREDFKTRVEVVKNDTFQEIQENKGPFLLYASHQCNWEWLAIAVGSQLVPIDPIYKKIQSKKGDSLMKEIRGKLGNRPILNIEVGRTLRKHHEHRGAGIVADQSPTRKNKGKTWAQFMGKETPFYQGIFVLPYLTQLPAYYVSMSRVSRGMYQAELHQLARPPYEKGDFSVLKKYTHFSESEIMANPSDWLWSHNRWKYPRSKNEELINFQ